MRRYKSFRLALALLLAAVAVCGAEARAQESHAQAGVDVSRIVSIGGAVTEILYDLGKQGQIVGVDTTSLFPPEALKSKPSVGYMRQLSPEGIVGLNPSVVLAIAGSGPPEALKALEAARVPIVLVPDAFSEDGILDKIGRIGGIVKAADRANCLMENVRAEFAALRGMTARVEHPLRVMFILSLTSDRILAAGKDTAANAIIGLAGGRNAFDAFSGYKAVSAEAIIAARPDAVLVMQRTQGAISADDVFSRPEFASTPAARARNFIAMDGLYLLGFGPRTASAARELSAALYPLPAPASASGAATATPATCK